MLNSEAKNLIERLRDWDNTSYGRNRKDMIKAADLLEQQSERLAKLEERISTIYSQPVELPRTVKLFENDDHIVVGYTTDQLTKAVQEATARALEDAAKECEARYMGDNNREDMEAKRCASAIRNLIGRVK